VKAWNVTSQFYVTLALIITHRLGETVFFFHKTTGYIFKSISSIITRSVITPIIVYVAIWCTNYFRPLSITVNKTEKWSDAQCTKLKLMESLHYIADQIFKSIVFLACILSSICWLWLFAYCYWVVSCIRIYHIAGLCACCCFLSFPYFPKNWPEEGKEMRS